MKKLIILIILTLSLTGCTKTKKEQINVLNWSSYIPDEIILDFEKETGIKVNYSTYSSNEELLAKVSNAKKGTYDLIFPSDYMIKIMINKNMSENIDKTKLKNYSNLNEKYLNQPYDKRNKYSLPFLAASTIISINREFIKDEITSYNDLLNTKYKNEVVLIDDERIIIGMALLANGFDMNSVEKNELEIAKEWLLKLKDNIKAYDSDSPKSFLISKEASIAVLWNAEATIANWENKNIENVYPKEGVALSIDNFAIPKDAQNQEIVYKFIDYILEPTIMKKIIESYPYKNVNKETDKILSNEYKNNIASNIPDYIFRKGDFVENIGNNIKLYDKIWVDIK